MSVSLTHTFVSAKGDGTDATQVQPSHWNAQHVLTCAGNSLVGNSTGAPAAVGDIPCTTQGRSILNAATLADLIAAGIPIFSTGDVKLTLKAVADTGWLLCNDQTIGNTGSGATFADPTANALFVLIWNNVSNTYAPVSGGRGASAAADWAGGKNIQITSLMGRAIAVAGSGSGLSARTLGQTAGEENHTLSSAEMPSHTHVATVTDPGHTHTLNNATLVLRNNGSTGFNNIGGSLGGSNTLTENSATTGVTVANANTGSGGAHNNMQPTTFINAMIKL